MGWVDDFLKGVAKFRFGGLMGGAPTAHTAPVAKPLPSSTGMDPGLANMLDPTGTKGKLPFNSKPNDPNALKQLLNPPVGTGLQQNVNSPFQDLNEIYKQLLANAALVPGGGLSEADIRAQVASKYDPQVNRVRREIDVAKNQYGRNKDTLKQLYDELEADYRKEVGGIEKYYGGQQSEEQSRMGALQDRIKSNYQDTYADQQQNFDKLGIQDALAGSTRQQSQDLEYLQNLSQVEGESVMRDIGGQERANRDYFNKGASLSNMRGAEALTDLLNEFSDYRMLREGDISDLQAARSTDISALMAQMAQQKAQSQGDIFSRLLQAGNFGMDLNKLQMSAQPQVQKPEVVGKGITGAQQVLSSISNPQRAQQLMGLFQQVMLSQPFTENRFETKSGDIVDMTPQQAVQYMLDAASKSGVSDSEKIALMNAVYAYYGRF